MSAFHGIDAHVRTIIIDKYGSILNDKYGALCGISGETLPSNTCKFKRED